MVAVAYSDLPRYRPGNPISIHFHGRSAVKMFQTFDDVTDPSLAAVRIAELRAQMATIGADGFLVPRADEHQGEYVAPGAERLKWLTGFSGSAGAALVLADQAVIFVDGRYTFQVREQTDGKVFAYDDLTKNPPSAWLKANATAGFRLAIDPWLHTVRETRNLRKALSDVGGELLELDTNPIDNIWPDQPSPPLGQVSIHDQRYAGKLATAKLAEMVKALEQARVTHTVLTDPSSIAWTFNIRGSDVPHTPLALAFAIIGADGVHRLFIDKRKLSMTVEAYLTQLCDLYPPSH